MTEEQEAKADSGSSDAKCDAITVTAAMTVIQA